MSTHVNQMSSMGDAGLLSHTRALIVAKFNQSRCLNKQKPFVGGFSLLELLVVVSLLGMLALATTVMVDNTDDQQRFELTRTRLQQIRTAIIGDTSRTFNGEPVLSGFAIDMGRLPTNINELVELPAGANVWQGFPIATSSASAVGEVYAGWRGPYLDVMPSAGASAVRAFRDGWANDDGTDNFGWAVAISGTSPNHSALSIKSYGSDGPTGTGTSVYEEDYPASGNLVEPRDWQVDFSAIDPAFRVTINGLLNQNFPNLRLYVFFMKSNAASSYADAFVSNAMTAVSGVPAQVFDVAHESGTSVLPIGKLAAVLVCEDGHIFDGNCDSDVDISPFYFPLLPRAFAPPINIQWNIQ
ncbi:prepilin-type N-terminal cleavage/methylation domain-containing protein [Methylotenera sp. L2L1]|uniref:prepilin-type N-terminal cleavage/methylation domain-containing protein n=1 Tax=Methylotenera sp. L2L1 TaxID=1502770 RepID=UPI00055DA8A4|nr:prepilin-type N-terminal cleavage/methylation domain-containing protein [Methylotenera sp. L2L1]